MPQFEILYYPGFEPSKSWLRSYLLFWDKVNTIVPTDIDFKFSREVMEIADFDPDGIGILAPKEEDIVLNELSIKRLGRAFKILKERITEDDRKGITVVIGRDGTFRFNGYVFLHESKMSSKVRSLLERHKLIRYDLDPLTKSLGAQEGFSIVNEAASHLILSHLAGKIGDRHGIGTVTDKELDFTVNSLNSFGIERTQNPDVLLASSIINFEIPENVCSLEPNKYKKLRDAYRDIRVPFHRTVSDLSSLYKLGTIDDENVLRERISQITSEFDAEVQKFKKTDYGKKIEKWVPIGIGILASVASKAFSSPKIAITGVAVQSVIQIVQAVRGTKESPSESAKVQKLLAKTQKDLLRMSEIKRLI